MLKVIAHGAAREDLAAGLDEIVRERARRMLAAALEDEVAAYIAAHAAERDETGRRLVVRNGYARPRQVPTAAGALEIRAPRVNDGRVDEATGQRARFRVGDLAAVVPQEPEGDRGAAAVVSARTVGVWCMSPVQMRACAGGTAGARPPSLPAFRCPIGLSPASVRRL
jgi:Transposase, Mutator family